MEDIYHRDNGWMMSCSGPELQRMAHAIAIVQQRGVVGLIYTMCERCRAGDIPSELDGEHNRWHKSADDPDDLSACSADALWSLVNDIE